MIVLTDKKKKPIHDEDKLFRAWNYKEFNFMSKRDMEYTLPDTVSQSKYNKLTDEI